MSKGEKGKEREDRGYEKTQYSDNESEIKVRMRWSRLGKVSLRVILKKRE